MLERKQLLDFKLNTERIDKVYKINKNDKPLGKGNFGMVVRGEDRVNGQLRAIKIIKKSKFEEEGLDLELLSNEVNILLKLDHPNIIRIYEVYDDQKYLYFVMELMDGKSLFDCMFEEAYQNNEKKVREFFFQIMKGLQYLHRNGIAHRDIKPQNIMFVDKSMEQLKIIDFGVSKYFFKNSNPNEEITLRTKTGSLYYIPPEIMDGKYDCRCDVWSAGVLLYLMIAGVPPFYDANPMVVVEKVKKVEYNFLEKVWDKVSSECKDLITKMVAVADKRFTSDQVLGHPWMKLDMEKKEYQVELESVKNFFRGSKLSKLFKELLAASCSEVESDNLGKLFVELDENGDGVINREELIAGLRNSLKFNDQELVDAITKAFPQNADIQYNSFFALLLNPALTSNDSRIEKIFNGLDQNKDGRITAEDLVKFQKHPKKKEGAAEDLPENADPLKKYQEYIKEVDKEGKGYLTLDDIKLMMKSK